MPRTASDRAAGGTPGPVSATSITIRPRAGRWPPHQGAPSLFCLAGRCPVAHCSALRAKSTRLALMRTSAGHPGAGPALCSASAPLRIRLTRTRNICSASATISTSGGTSLMILTGAARLKRDAFGRLLDERTQGEPAQRRRLVDGASISHCRLTEPDCAIERRDQLRRHALWASGSVTLARRSESSCAEASILRMS